jgi:hypothetical protein
LRIRIFPKTCRTGFVEAEVEELKTCAVRTGIGRRAGRLAKRVK